MYIGYNSMFARLSLLAPSCIASLTRTTFMMTVLMTTFTSHEQDATNTTRKRRAWIREQVDAHEGHVKVSSTALHIEMWRASWTLEGSISCILWSPFVGNLHDKKGTQALSYDTTLTRHARALNHAMHILQKKLAWVSSRERGTR